MSPEFIFMALLSYVIILLVAGSILVAPNPKLQIHKLSPVREEFPIQIMPGNRRLLAATTTTATNTELPTFRANLARASFAINVTRAERLYGAVKRSKARAKALVANVHSSKTNKLSASMLDYTSPVALNQGVYTMEIYLGSPPQKFNAIVDTGSDLVWVQCDPCTQCYRQNDPIFSPKKSSTFSKTSCTTSTCQGLHFKCSKPGNTCSYDYRYGDNSSTQGDFALETISLTSTDGSKKGFSNFEFGCGRLNSGLFDSAADGIVGLGQGPISLTTQLGSAINHRFSYCLVDFDNPSSTSPLIFGASASAEGGISTPIIPNSDPGSSTFYFVGLEAVVVGGKQLSLTTKSISFTSRNQRTGKRIRTRALEVNSGGTIFDSGTTLTIFDDGVYAKIKTAFSESISLPNVDGSSVDLDLCYDVSQNENYTFPSLTLAFKGANFTPPLENYFMFMDTMACLAMAGSLGVGIIGNLMQQNYQVLYDIAAGTISLAPAKCDSL